MLSYFSFTDPVHQMDRRTFVPPDDWAVHFYSLSIEDRVHRKSHPRMKLWSCIGKLQVTFQKQTLQPAKLSFFPPLDLSDRVADGRSRLPFAWASVQAEIMWTRENLASKLTRFLPRLMSNQVSGPISLRFRFGFRLGAVMEGLCADAKRQRYFASVRLVN